VLGQLAGKRVIWLGPGVTTRPDLEAYRDPIRDAQRQVVESAGGAWINSQDLTRERELRDDGVHFSAGGYDRWAQALLPRLARVVGGPQGSQGLPVWVGPVAVGAGALFALGAYLWSRSR
jgi:hypothetical protein